MENVLFNFVIKSLVKISLMHTQKRDQKVLSTKNVMHLGLGKDGSVFSYSGAKRQRRNSRKLYKIIVPRFLRNAFQGHFGRNYSWVRTFENQESLPRYS